MSPKLSMPPLQDNSSRGPMGLPPVVEKTPHDIAVAAVRVFEQLHSVVINMRQDWEQKYPDAYADQGAIKQQEDLVTEAIKAAKIAVAEARETIGDFKCQNKKSTAGYEETEFTKILNSLENAGEVIAELVRSGVIENVVLDKKVCTAYMARNPQMAEAFKPAWQDSKELTPAVTVPKI
jgi:hypothetical protein